MYSIPAYALRFAAHCRSRLKLSEAQARDAGRSADQASTTRFWIWFATHEDRASLTGKCALPRIRIATR